MADDGTQWHVSPLGGLKRRGHWRVPPRMIAVSLLGGADLDLRDAEMPGPEARFTWFSILGGAKISAPPGIRVEVSGFSLVGGQDVDAGPPAAPDAPVLRVKAFALIGGVEVRGT